VLSVIGPARRAVRTAPVAALVATREEQAESLRRRATIGGLAATAGIATLVAGLTGASILLVGVGAVAVLGASLSQSARTNLESAVTAEDIITGPSSGFSTSVAAAVSRIPGVSTVTNVYKGQFELRGSLSSLDAVTPAGLRRTVHLAITAGSGARASPPASC
jgi:hypothetical protein